MLSRRRAAVAVLAVPLLAAAGCSTAKSAPQREPYTGTSTAAEVNGVQKVTLTVDATYRFSPSTITVHQGKVEITIRHIGGGAPHDWQLSKFPSDYVPLTSAGQTRSVTFTAPSPGRYQFLCTIHSNQGMTGTLVVVPG